MNLKSLYEAIKILFFSRVSLSNLVHPSTDQTSHGIKQKHEMISSLLRKETQRKQVLENADSNLKLVITRNGPSRTIRTVQSESS